jgi:predicted esterase
MKRFFVKVACAVVVVSSVFGITSILEPAKAQDTVPVTTFETSYKAYNDATSWRTKMTMAERCSDTQKIYGARPATPGNHPVLIYLHGTFAEWGKNKEGQQFVKRAASLGYTALALTYDSTGSLNEKGLQRHAYCMFDQNHSSDGLSTACSVAGADCSKGVVLAGFSQGAAIATIAKNYNDKVKAVWAIGLSAYIYPRERVYSDALPAPYGTRVLPNDKLVINMGQSSSLSKKNLIPEDMPSLKQLTGADCGSNLQCLQPNGSGYYVVANNQVADGTADHAYWMRVNSWWNKSGLSFTFSPKEFDPGFQPPATTDWSMTRNLEWLRQQLNQ